MPTSAPAATQHTRFIPPGGPSRPWQLIRFRHFIDGSLALASLNRTCRDHRPDVSAALTTVVFDQSGLRWLGISDLIAEPEGPTFISYKVARSRLDGLRFVTQDPQRKLASSPVFGSGGVPLPSARRQKPVPAPPASVM